MIKFFRHIRQNLIMENKTSKYLKYAIGEIVLVVIGILIALQINNWNQKRLDNIERHGILKNMHLEFKANKDQVLEDIYVNYNTLNTGKKLIDLIGADEATLKVYNLDSLIYNLLVTGSKNFVENTITELIQTGKRKYIENDTLKNLIFDWTQKLESVEFFFGESQERLKLILSYLRNRYPLKNVDAYGDMRWQEPSNLNIDKLTIFSDIKFENLLDDYLANIYIFIDRENKLLDVIEQIIKATESYN